MPDDPDVIRCPETGRILNLAPLPPAYHWLTPRQRQILTRKRTKHLPPPDLAPPT